MQRAQRTILVIIARLKVPMNWIWQRRTKMVTGSSLPRGLSVSPGTKTGSCQAWSANAIQAWAPKHNGKQGRPQKFSDLAIETVLTLRLVFHLPLRQAEGFVHSVLSMMGLELPTVPVGVPAPNR